MREREAQKDFRLEEFGVRTSSWATAPLSLTLKPGTLCALLGAAGSGKSLVLERLAGVRRPNVTLQGKHTKARIAFVPQDARLSVLPTDEVSSLLRMNGWALRLERLVGWRTPPSDTEAEAARLLKRLRLDPERVATLPFRELSASERRRVLVCSALIDDPEVLLFDGWDEMMDGQDRRALSEILSEKRAEGLTIVASTRRLPLADLTPSQIVELEGDLSTGEHAVPLMQRSSPPSLHEHPILEVNRLTVARGGRVGIVRRQSRAFPVDGASLFVRHGETVVLLGGSGSGKTTLLQTIAGLHSPSRGTIRVSNHDVTYARGSRAQRLRRDVQLVFQNATAVLDGHRTVRAHIEEARSLARGTAPPAAEWLEKLGLSPRLLAARADELSTSESQRVDLARSLVLGPKLVLFDAPEISGADSDHGLLSSVVNAQKAAGCSFLVTTSSPEVAASLADRIAILHAGRVIEFGSRAEVLESPAHPVTELLLQAKPFAPTDPTAPSSGCPHFAQCPKRELPLCDEKEPMLAPLVTLDAPEASGARRVACFRPLDSGTERP